MSENISRLKGAAGQLSDFVDSGTPEDCKAQEPRSILDHLQYLGSELSSLNHNAGRIVEHFKGLI